MKTTCSFIFIVVFSQTAANYEEEKTNTAVEEKPNTTMEEKPNETKEEKPNTSMEEKEEIANNATKKPYETWVTKSFRLHNDYMISIQIPSKIHV